MDKNRIAGSVNEAKGAIKKTVGKATGDAKLRDEGRAEEAAGKVQNAIGGMRDAARKVLNK